MRIAVAVTPGGTPDAVVSYRWDADTDILIAQVAGVGGGTGLSGQVGIEGGDGSWLNLELSGGRIAAIEVAVWPDVNKVPVLELPDGVTDADVVMPARPSQPGLASVEVDTRIVATADAAERTIHFRLGAGRSAHTVRVARDILLDLDDSRHITGIWMLNVPPFPAVP